MKCSRCGLEKADYLYRQGNVIFPVGPACVLRRKLTPVTLIGERKKGKRGGRY